jgi:hypothetical protein
MQATNPRNAVRRQAVLMLLTEWLAPRGLALNEDKTSIRHASEGFDFLGFTICRYPNGKLIIRPSTAAIRRIRERLRQVFRQMRGATAGALIRKLNQIIAGWAAYYRAVVSSTVFTSLDDYVWKLAYKWATRRHRNKPKKWIVARYFGRFDPTRKDRWVFSDRDSGVYLRKFSWTKIVWHQMVPGGASPDDPALTDYWTTRRHKHRSLLIILSSTSEQRSSLQDTPTPWPKPRSACSRPNCSTTAAHGKASMMSNWPAWNGSTGTTTDGSTAPATT